MLCSFPAQLWTAANAECPATAAPPVQNTRCNSRNPLLRQQTAFLNMQLCILPSAGASVQPARRPAPEARAFGNTAAAACSRRRLRCQAKKPKGQEVAQEPAAAQADTEADEELRAELEAAAASGRRPVILDDFSNFTPDPPGHRAGKQQAARACKLHAACCMLPSRHMSLASNIVACSP